MMNAIVILGLVVCATAQMFPWMRWTSDRIHDYTFEYHSQHDMMLVINSDTCWIVDVDKSVDAKLRHHDSRNAFEDVLYAMIKAHTGEVHGENSELRRKYQDTRAYFECMKHDVYHLAAGAMHPSLAS